MKGAFWEKFQTGEHTPSLVRKGLLAQVGGKVGSCAGGELVKPLRGPIADAAGAQLAQLLEEVQAVTHSFDS